MHTNEMHDEPNGQPPAFDLACMERKSVNTTHKLQSLAFKADQKMDLEI